MMKPAECPPACHTSCFICIVGLQAWLDAFDISYLVSWLHVCDSSHSYMFLRPQNWLHVC